MREEVVIIEVVAKRRQRRGKLWGRHVSAWDT